MSNPLNKKNKLELAIHLLVWLILFYIPVALSYGTNSKLFDIAIRFWLQLSILAIIFYYNYLWFVERYLIGKGKKWIFVLINLFIFLFFSWIKHQIFLSIEKPDGNRSGPPIGFIWYMDFFTYLIPVAFAIAIRMSKRLVGMEVYKTEAENIKLQADLQHLKFQLQPHFFFNALNNIYSLIETDPEKARTSIHSMSKLMRHLLQVSEVAVTTLLEEIDFLKKYIILMQVRLNEKTRIETNFPDHIPNIQIAPLLFISIVENAFKHGVSASHESNISFSLKLSDNTITFISQNKSFSKSSSDLSGSGIGLENLRKRLRILYPSRHSFTTNLADDIFEATLQLNLK